MTVLLTAAAGAIDVVTYFAFNQVFASTMTGNLVLLGLGLGQGDVTQVVDNVCAMLGYCGGLVAGTVFCGLAMRRWPWRNAVGATLTFELALLLVLGAFWYGVDDDSPIAPWKVVVLVVGAGLAMGVQAAALRYVGPAGTPTSFLSGTVTNWVSSLVELHKPFSWNWNSPLRLLAVVAAAGGNAVVQRFAPDWSFVAPVVLVAAAIVLMAVVTRANSGGLTAGEPQFAPDPREEVPHAGEDEAGVGGVGPVHGRVLGEDGDARPAVLTLVSSGGEQVAREHTDPDGAYRLEPPESGEFMLICTPHRMGGRAARPRAALIAVDGHPVVHDVVLGAAAGEAGHHHEPAPT
ncbi:YoaK family protein [Actinomycetospora aeridis]|uniref:YoaK family protein n=1 Tax=Actinomycetospora aeridis TaxID=3129231 RepID=A0ABU8N0M5_9PSEU